MAAHVQQHHVAFRHPFQRSQHLLHLQGVRFRRVVRVAIDRESGAPEHTGMIGPSRVAKPNGGSGKLRAQKIGPHPQGGRASRGVDGRDAPFPDGGVVRPEDHLLHDLGIGRFARDAEIIFRGLLLQPHFFGLLDRVQHRIDARLVQINAGGKVDLAGIGIVAEIFRQAENGVRRCRLHLGEGSVGHRWAFRDRKRAGGAYSNARARQWTPRVHPPRNAFNGIAVQEPVGGAIDDHPTAFQDVAPYSTG